MCDLCSCPGDMGKSDYWRTDGQDPWLVFTPCIHHTHNYSVSAVINNNNILPFLPCCVLLNASYLFATVALGSRKRKEDREDTHIYLPVTSTSFVPLIALWSRYYPVFKKEELKGMPFFSLLTILKPTWICKQRYARASLQTSGIPGLGIIPNIWNIQLVF